MGFLKKKSIVLYLVLGVLAFNACKKGGCNVIPDTQVTEIVSLVQYPQLRIPYGYAEISTGGIAGLIVINLGNDQYAAYDRCSPVNPVERCAVQVDASGLIAVDPCSQATFLLKNGSPASIAECPLKPYRASKRGETIVIVN